MSEEARLREELCRTAASLYERGLTHGSTGNISARAPDGGLIVTPTGSSFGRLDPAALSRFDAGGRFLSGHKPTKEMPLHEAFYATRSSAGAVVHLHSCHSVAWSLLPEVDADDLFPHLTAYAIMQLGRVKLLPFFLPGDPAMADAIRGLAGKRSAVMLAHHGPVVAGKDLAAAANAMEELEATARLALLTRGLGPRLLSEAEVGRIVSHFDVEWGE